MNSWPYFFSQCNNGTSQGQLEFAIWIWSPSEKADFHLEFIDSRLCCLVDHGKCLQGSSVRHASVTASTLFSSQLLIVSPSLISTSDAQPGLECCYPLLIPQTHQLSDAHTGFMLLLTTECLTTNSCVISYKLYHQFFYFNEIRVNSDFFLDFDWWMCPSSGLLPESLSDRIPVFVLHSAIHPLYWKFSCVSGLGAAFPSLVTAP